MEAGNICEIEKLVELFNLSRNQNEDEEEADDSLNTVPSSKDRQKAKAKSKISPYAKLDAPAPQHNQNDPDDTLTEENIEKFYFSDELAANKSESDWKKTPQWTISYKQNVTASDVFLGMGFKTPATSSCENMIIKIDLPGESRQNINLKIEQNQIVITSPKFYLDLKLPHPVDPKLGHAEFDKIEEKLIVSLVMNREFDLLNF